MIKDCSGHVLQCKLQFLYYLSLHKNNCFYYHYLSNKIFTQLKNFYLNLSSRAFLMTQIKISGYPIFSSLSLHLLVSSQPNWKWLLLYLEESQMHSTFCNYWHKSHISYWNYWWHSESNIWLDPFTHRNFLLLSWDALFTVHTQAHPYIHIYKLIFLEPRIKI